MNSINSAVTSLFDLALRAFEWGGVRFTLIMVSGVFGILALIAFKYISYQKGIKAAKDRIKGHLIEIRLYQDDLRLVSKAIAKVLMRNFQYLFYNFGPFVPLAIPFVFVLAQLVVRYGFDPVPITPTSSLAMVGGPNGTSFRKNFLPGSGTLLSIEFATDRKTDAAQLEIRLPEGLEAVSPLVRSATDGKAFQEIVATAPGDHEIVLLLPGGLETTKHLVAGDRSSVRWMQPERVSSALSAMLWPAEEQFDASTGLARVSFEYPDSDLGWMPGGPLGIILVFLIASMAFGFALLKPLGIQI
jgi:hypothetical protein